MTIISWLTSNIAVVRIASKIEDTHVDRPALAVQRPHHIRSADSLTLAHFDDGGNVAQKVLEKELQVEAYLLVDRG